VLRLDRPVAPVLAALARRGIFGDSTSPTAIRNWDIALPGVRDRNQTRRDIDGFAGALADIMNPSRAAA